MKSNVHNAEELEECLQFLSIEQRVDVKCVALQYVLGLTGTSEGRAVLAQNSRCLLALVRLTADQPGVAKDAFMALINLSAQSDVSDTLVRLSHEEHVVLDLLEYMLGQDNEHADAAAAVLANLSRTELGSTHIIDVMSKTEVVGFNKVIESFCRKDHNKRKAKLHHIGSVLSNLTQTQAGRLHVLDKQRCVIQRLLPFVEYQGSLTRRGGIVGTLRNCCFETDYHDWLLGPDVDLLSRLLLPLAGGEEFDDDDMEKLPEDLQYLEPDKQREEDPDVRRMLVEALNLLCARHSGRKYIRDKNTYVILRELHTWERDAHARLALEQLIQLLIGDEPETGLENLDKVAIPKDVEQKLEKSRTAALVDADNENSGTETTAN